MCPLAATACGAGAAHCRIAVARAINTAATTIISEPGTGMPKPIARQRTANRRPPAKSTVRNSGKQRGIGRPAAGQQTVGREALITRTCEMLMMMPPNKITRAEVARHMNVDPSLIRYYFRDRSTLLLAAVARLSAEFDRNRDQAMQQADQGA